MATTDLTYLLPRLRLRIGDTDESSYRYIDDWLIVALVGAIESLQRWWNYKYLIDENDLVYRNPNCTFVLPEPPVVERGDTQIIVLMASIVIKSGDMQSLSWNLGSWKDAEISYSNIESGKSKSDSIKRDWEELKSLITPPTRKLSFPVKGHLPGYTDNKYEYD
jgi:hypothetical protein